MVPMPEALRGKLTASPSGKFCMPIPTARLLGTGGKEQQPIQKMSIEKMVLTYQALSKVADEDLPMAPKPTPTANPSVHWPKKMKSITRSWLAIVSGATFYWYCSTRVGNSKTKKNAHMLSSFCAYKNDNHRNNKTEFYAFPQIYNEKAKAIRARPWYTMYNSFIKNDLPPTLQNIMRAQNSGDWLYLSTKNATTTHYFQTKLVTEIIKYASPPQAD